MTAADHIYKMYKDMLKVIDEVDVYGYFSKALDMVPHGRLVRKVKNKMR